MLLETFSDKFEYQKLSKEEMTKRGILGRLVGVIADTKNPTRNGRQYSEELWNKVFDNQIMQEKIKNRCVFGELGHPEDRTEIDMEKIAVCLAEQPKKSSNGKLYGVFDILNTKCGQLLKTLCDYGCTVGISSRGTGETYQDYDGNEMVDPATYDCVGWDVVLVPSVKEARLNLVNESLERKNLKSAIKESLNQQSPDDRKLLEGVLKQLNIELTFDKPVTVKDKDDIISVTDKSLSIKNSLSSDNMDSIESLDNNINTSSQTVSNFEINGDNDDLEYPVAENNGTNKILIDLTEQLKINRELNNKILALQEELSVSNAKEIILQEKVSTLSNTIGRLTKSQTELKAKNNKLTHELSILAGQLSLVKKDITNGDSTINGLKESIDAKVYDNNKLLESLNEKDNTIKALTNKCDSLQESYKEIKQTHKNEVTELREQLIGAKQDLQIKTTEYMSKLRGVREQLNKANKIAKISIDKYIETKANMIGVPSIDIKNRLSENYTFNDIDRVCEEVKSYNINMSKLPFTLGNNVKIKTNFVEGRVGNTQLSKKNQDDIVDDDLLSLVEKITNY